MALLLLASLAGCAPVAPARPAKPIRLSRPSIEIETPGWPRREVLDLAMRAYQCADREHPFRNPMLTVIDYSLPSGEPRLWVIDVERKRVLNHELVAHGQNSGGTRAVTFSNRVGSLQSSLGLFRTDEVYVGQHGYSLRISGLEPGFNDRARERAIVIHGAPYVSRVVAAEYGGVGRSWGCPALPVGVTSQIIDRIAEGSAIFAYYPDPDWLRASRYLHCAPGQYAGR
jgi:hypothetical protein